MDISKLEYDGKISFILVSLDAEFLTNSVENFMTWEELVKWEYGGFNPLNGNSNGPFAVLIDDLEMLELIAPSPVEARKFMARAMSLLHISNSRVVSDSSADTLCSIIAFGRHPRDLRSQLPSLGDTASNGADNSERHYIGSTGAADISASTPLDDNMQPVLTEYLRYRYNAIIKLRHRIIQYFINKLIK